MFRSDYYLNSSRKRKKKKKIIYYFIVGSLDRFVSSFTRYQARKYIFVLLFIIIALKIQTFFYNVIKNGKRNTESRLLK